MKFTIFNKKPLKRGFGTHPAVCDCCEKPVGLNDCFYLCSICFEQLPYSIKQNIHHLNDFPGARKYFLRKIVNEKYF